MAADGIGVELQQRWRAIFTALAGGEDVPPALRLRTEGMMEAAVIAGVAEVDALIGHMNQCYRQAFGRTLEQDFGDDWSAFYPFPQIPGVGRRAPVYPSTSD